MVQDDLLKDYEEKNLPPSVIKGIEQQRKKDIEYGRETKVKVEEGKVKDIRAQSAKQRFLEQVAFRKRRTNLYGTIGKELAEKVLSGEITEEQARNIREGKLPSTPSGSETVGAVSREQQKPTTKQEFVKSIVERQEALRGGKREVTVGPTGEQIVIAPRSATVNIAQAPTITESRRREAREKEKRRREEAILGIKQRVFSGKERPAEMASRIVATKEISPGAIKLFSQRKEELLSKAGKEASLAHYPQVVVGRELIGRQEVGLPKGVQIRQGGKDDNRGVSLVGASGRSNDLVGSERLPISIRAVNIGKRPKQVEKGIEDFFSAAGEFGSEMVLSTVNVLRGPNPQKPKLEIGQTKLLSGRSYGKDVISTGTLVAFPALSNVGRVAVGTAIGVKSTQEFFKGSTSPGKYVFESALAASMVKSGASKIKKPSIKTTFAEEVATRTSKVGSRSRLVSEYRIKVGEKVYKISAEGTQYAINVGKGKQSTVGAFEFLQKGTGYKATQLTRGISEIKGGSIYGATQYRTLVEKGSKLEMTYGGIRTKSQQFAEVEGLKRFKVAAVVTEAGKTSLNIKKSIRLSPEDYAAKLQNEGKLNLRYIGIIEKAEALQNRFFATEGINYGYGKKISGKRMDFIDIALAKEGEVVPIYTGKPGRPRLEWDMSLSTPSERKITLAHELIHQRQPLWFRSIADPIPYNLQPAEIQAFGLQKYYAKKGFKVKGNFLEPGSSIKTKYGLPYATELYPGKPIFSKSFKGKIIGGYTGVIKERAKVEDVTFSEGVFKDVRGKDLKFVIEGINKKKGYEFSYPESPGIISSSRTQALLKSEARVQADIQLLSKTGAKQFAKSLAKQEISLKAGVKASPLASQLTKSTVLQKEVSKQLSKERIRQNQRVKSRAVTRQNITAERSLIRPLVLKGVRDLTRIFSKTIQRQRTIPRTAQRERVITRQITLSTGKGEAMPGVYIVPPPPPQFITKNKEDLPRITQPKKKRQTFKRPFRYTSDITAGEFQIFGKQTVAGGVGIRPLQRI